VVGMRMRDEPRSQRLTAQQTGVELFPGLFAHGNGHPCVDEDVPAGRLDQPNIDVVEVDRQRYARPENSVRDPPAVAGLRRRSNAIAKP